MAYTIMVAVDGEPTHRAPLDWAAARAARDGARLELIHVVVRSWGDSGEQPGRMLELAGRSLLAAEERYAVRRARVALDVGGRVLFGHPGREVPNASSGMDLAVVGTPPAADRQRAFAGSVAVRVAATARCTVVAVPHDHVPAGSGVVVGVDGEPSSGPAVDFAADEAAHLGEPLTIVCARGPGVAGPPDLPAAVAAAAAERARGRHPGLGVRTEVAEATPARALVAIAARARMLAVGTHDRHGVKRMVLGSVGHDVLLTAGVPVVVVRPRRPLPRRSA